MPLYSEALASPGDWDRTNRKKDCWVRWQLRWNIDLHGKPGIIHRPKIGHILERLGKCEGTAHKKRGNGGEYWQNDCGPDCWRGIGLVKGVISETGGRRISFFKYVEIFHLPVCERYKY